MNPEEGARRRLAAIALTDTPQGGPGGPVVDLLLMLAPLVFLVLVTISKRLYLPTSRSVPIAAGALYLFKLCYLGTAANPVTAALLQGVLLGLVPLSILFGAFFFYNVLDLTQCTEYVSMLVAQLCHGHPVAEVFLIVWGLGHAIEGASGFGTPGALLPPIAAGLGHDPFHCVVALLIATTTVGPFGSSGIGIWFGLAALDWPRAQLVHASFLVSLTMAVMSYPIGVMAARFLLSWKDMRRCWLFVLLSITSGAVPALAVAMFSFEVPALFSGVTAVVVTGLLARYRIGLTDDIPAMAARRLGKQTQQRQVAIDIPVDGTVQLELAAVPVVQQGAPGQAAPATAQDCPPAVPGYDRRPSFRTLRSRTVSGEDSSVSGAGNTALQLLSALNSPRRRASQQQQQQGGGGGLSRDSSRGTTSASSEMLLPGSRSHSAPSLSELLKASPPAEHLAGSHAGAAEKGSLVALPDVTTKSNGTSSNQLLPVSNTLPSKSSGNKGDGRSKHWKVVPWVMMMSVVAATRIPYLQKSNGQEMFISLRSLCDVRVASNLVITVDDILRTGTKWSYAMLYVPSLLPFVAVGCITLVLFRRNIPKAAHWGDPFKKSWNKCKSVMMALLSALVLVALMIQGELQSPAFIIGYWLSTWLKGGYIAVAMLLGAMGAFFSGSVATSNLTFGLLQEVAALRLQMPGAPMLMLQIVGGAAGQMISISNILGARAVMNLQHIPEGRFVNAALPACLLYYVIGTLISLPFLLGA